MGFNCAFLSIDTSIAGNFSLRFASIEIPVSTKNNQTDKLRH